MFVFIEFYRGKVTSKVERIDHDQLVDLIFETVPRVKQDPNWSFSVGFIPLPEVS